MPIEREGHDVRRLLMPSAALLWGLQFSFLNPALALLLVALYDATPAQIGWTLAVYNGGGFLAALVVPAYADRTDDYLRPMLGCGLLTLALTGVLALTSSLPIAVLALLVLGGPAGVGSSLLFAHLRRSGAGPSEVVNTRAVVSFAWVAGPPVAAIVMGSLGNRAILAAIAVVAVLNVTTTAAMLTEHAARREPPAGEVREEEPHRATPLAAIAVIVMVFVLLQATNNAVISVMGLFVTRTLGLDIAWAGITLGTAAALEVPALLLLGHLTRHLSSTTLITSGCLAGIAYYAAMATSPGLVLLLALQVLNAWSFAVVAGIGLTMFQELVPRPGLAAGLYTNTRRVGAVVSGPVIGLGSSSQVGYSGVFAVCAALTTAALFLTGLTRASNRRPP